MPRERKLELKNIKVSLFVNNKIIVDSKIQIYNPFDNVIITIYKHTPNLINLTGVDSFKKLDEVKKFVKNFYGCRIVKQRIDAIMLNYKSEQRMGINLERLVRILKFICRCPKNHGPIGVISTVDCTWHI